MSDRYGLCGGVGGRVEGWLVGTIAFIRTILLPVYTLAALLLLLLLLPLLNPLRNEYP